MTCIDLILRLAAVYGEATGLGPSAVSWRVFGDSKKLPALRDGKDIQVRRCERALAWFAENWPEGAAWPADVPRGVTPGHAGAAA